MFVFTAGFVLKQFEIYAQNVLAAVNDAMAGADLAKPEADVYGRIPVNSFDKAIMEKSGSVMVVPCDPDWSDIGSWQSLWDIAPKDAQGNVFKGEIVETETRNCFIQGQKGRVIACAGVENLVVVDMGDAILVADRRNTDSLRVLVARLKEAGHDEILRSLAVEN
jgi:mannose-1-phosphate guanylyltransferase